MQRWHSEQALMLKRWRLEMKEHGYDWRNPPTDAKACHCARGIGALRKRSGYDCGNPQCGLCHWSKFYEPKRRASHRRAAITYELEAYG